MKFYTASKSRNQGREGWSVIFRHPARLDMSTGKPGRRIRRGLATAEEAEATRLVEELNELLSTEELWDAAARVSAVGRFDPRIVEIFYEGLEATRIDFPALRESILPLPTTRDGYRSVLLLGTTGAGKTTVVRQILGTDPRSERFPSTSTAKTTVADTELITAGEGPYRAVVTFVPRDEVIDYLTENVSAAALAVLRERPDHEVTRKLLDHVNQRFRFSYVLGRVGAVEFDDLVDDDEDDSEVIDPSEYGEIDVVGTAKVVSDAVEALKLIVAQHARLVKEDLQDLEEDARVVTEYIEENLDTDLRQSEQFHEIVDALLDEIEKRFASLEEGQLKRNRQGWPTTWSWESSDRELFMKAISRFSSNYAPLFGRLLTPLVNGIRVSGQFGPAWTSQPVRLVLVDGEGLGHTPKSAATLSTHVAEQLEQADTVLLVDNAAQPMQAAPVAALKSIAISGNATKLHLLFTHFDQVLGDNLPTFSAREAHVLASVDNALKAIGDELGPVAERGLRRRVDSARFFVGDIQQPLNAGKKAGARAAQQFDALVTRLAHADLAEAGGSSRPVFDRMNLSLAVSAAASAFHARWRGLLGLDMNPDAPKEHWTRVKALTRRLAEGWTDQYDTLRPVADLRNQLQSQIFLMLQRPVRWDGGEPSDDDKQRVIDAMANAITKKLMDLTRRRVAEDARLGWQEAYAQHGAGSTFVRARIIAAEVYDRGVPIPSVSASPDQNKFMREVAVLVGDVCQDLDVILE